MGGWGAERDRVAGATEEWKRRTAMLERQVQCWRGAVGVLLVMGLLLSPLKTGTAQGPGLPQRVEKLEQALAAEIAARQAADTTLTTNLNNEIAARQAADTTLTTNLNNEIAARQAADATLTQKTNQLGAQITGEQGVRQAADTALQNQITPLASKLERVSIQNIGGYYSIVISGANLHVVNGQGSTTTSNGLGNLIVGYNAMRTELDAVNKRWGSHCLVIGDRNNYSSYGGIVAGFANSIAGAYASVYGGAVNTASGDRSTVSGGSGNVASALYASVSGGSGNLASGQEASVSGGSGNVASGVQSSVSGGSERSASSLFQWAAGGLLQNN